MSAIENETLTAAIMIEFIDQDIVELLEIQKERNQLLTRLAQLSEREVSLMETNVNMNIDRMRPSRAPDDSIYGDEWNEVGNA